MEQGIKDKLFLITVIIFVGLIGFGLGRLSSKYQTAKLNINSTISNATDLSKIATSEQAVKVTESNNKQESKTTASVSVTVSDQHIEIIGNKNSKIYHREDCPGALKMSESNRILFDSISAAKAAGYRPAGNCPGLE